MGKCVGETFFVTRNQLVGFIWTGGFLLDVNGHTEIYHGVKNVHYNLNYTLSLQRELGYMIRLSLITPYVGFIENRII